MRLELPSSSPRPTRRHIRPTLYAAPLPEVHGYPTYIAAFLAHVRALITPLGPTEAARSRALPAAQVTRIDDRTLRTTP